MREDLIERLRREAAISARAGQLSRLNALADEFAAALESSRADAARLEEALREAYGQVRELCDAHVHPYPEASFARYEAALLPTAAQEKDDA